MFPRVVHRGEQSVALFHLDAYDCGIAEIYWMSRPWFAFPPESITAVEERLSPDSHTSMNGNLTATVAATCTSCFKHGVIAVDCQVVGQRMMESSAATKLTIGGTLELLRMERIF